MHHRSASKQLGNDWNCKSAGFWLEALNNSSIIVEESGDKAFGKRVKNKLQAYILVTTSRYKWIPLCVLAIIYGNFLLMVETIAFKNVGRSHSYPVEVQIALTLFLPGSANANAYTRKKSMGGNSDNCCIFLNVC